MKEDTRDARAGADDPVGDGLKADGDRVRCGELAVDKQSRKERGDRHCWKRAGWIEYSNRPQEKLELKQHELTIGSACS